MFMVHNGGVGSMSAASDYDNTRAARQKKQLQPPLKRKTRIAFQWCPVCNYSWSRRVFIDNPECICPKFGREAIEE